MDKYQLREELANDEGCKYEVYHDHLGYPTFGIGHLITDDDPECGASVGTEVSSDRVQEAFDSDIESVLSDCERLYVQFEHLPEEVQLIIANMMFNMGYTRLSKFNGMKRGVDARDWEAAADEMVDSKWYRQVSRRADRLVVRMRSVGEK
jgi:GH24 family phage-related lysozyme (muramidase)